MALYFSYPAVSHIYTLTFFLSEVRTFLEPNSTPIVERDSILKVLCVKRLRSYVFPFDC